MVTSLHMMRLVFGKSENRHKVQATYLLSLESFLSRKITHCFKYVIIGYSSNWNERMHTLISTSTLTVVTKDFLLQRDHSFRDWLISCKMHARGNKATRNSKPYLPRLTLAIQHFHDLHLAPILRVQHRHLLTSKSSVRQLALLHHHGTMPPHCHAECCVSPLLLQVAIVT